MKKRVLAVLTVVMLVTCMLAVGISAGAATTDRFDVGYSILDVNPYVYSANLGFGVKNLGTLATDSTNTVAIAVKKSANAAATTERLIRVPMAGFANSTERLSTGIFNDNGDSFTGIGDGLHVTATTVTDSNGTTLVYFTIDAISGYLVLHMDVAERLASALGVQKNHIFVNGSHSHEAPDYNTLRKTNPTTNQERLWKAYYDYMVDRMVQAATEAYNSRTECKMYKTSMDVSEESTDKFHLNYVRNYKVILKNGTVSYVFGSGFGDLARPTSGNNVAKVESVSEADDTMHILQFTPTSGTAAPIILVNWRCHATSMGEYSDDYAKDIHLLSADYIASFRYQMQKAGYRCAFLQGAAGNLVPWHALSSVKSSATVYDGYTDWLDYMDANDGQNDTSYHDGGIVDNLSIYYGGTALTRAAKDCLNKLKKTAELTPGPIQTVNTVKDLAVQQDSAGVIAAAEYCRSHSVTYPYKHTYNGGTYIINSSHHANNVYTRANADQDTYADMPLSAILLGKSVAFVTAPTEMLDRYSTSLTLNNTTDNDWLDLVDNTTYGTPFVMAYTNGHNGYTGNTLSFDTNKGSAAYALGSYEANISRTGRGEGEKVIAEYDRLLNIALNGYKTAYCKHCKTDVSWTPLLADAVDRTYTLETGHYYLYENVNLPTALNYGLIDGTVCLDLNGKTVRSNGRTFVVDTLEQSPEVAILSIQDSKGGGVIEAHERSSVGGAIYTAGGELNLYSGTLRTITGDDINISKGGVISVNRSTVNIYGGTVDASQCQLTTDKNNNLSGDSDGCGAAIAVYSTGILNISGGRVIGGKAEPEAGRGDCVFLDAAESQLTLSGNPVIDEIYFDYRSVKNFMISGNFTGSAYIAFNHSGRVTDVGADIGDVINDGTISGGSLACHDPASYVVASGADLTLVARKAHCEHCDQDVAWAPLLAQTFEKASTISSGHYYLYEDVPLPTVTNSVQISGQVCLDLNGKTLKSNGRSFEIISSTSILSIQDSVGGGAVESNGKAVNGGVIYTEDGAEFNLYSGTLQTVTGTGSTISKGGVIVANQSTVNIYGGIVDASKCHLVTCDLTYPGCGAAIFVYGSGALNVSGGQIIGGTAESNVGNGDCIFVETTPAKVTLSGDPVIDEIYFNEHTTVNFMISGEFTGNAYLRFNEALGLSSGDDIGNLINGGSVSNGRLICMSPSGYAADFQGAHIVLVVKDEECKHCGVSVVWTLLEAKDLSETYALESGHYFLYEDVELPAAANYGSISGEVCLDLNGKTLNTNGRSFMLTTSTAVLSIQDLTGNGAVVSNGNCLTGGVIYTEQNAVFNLYSGTLKTVNGSAAVISKGGVITANQSTVNIYGGTVDASQCKLSTSTLAGTTNGCGAAIYVYGSGTLNVHGGRIIAGEAEPNNGRGDCIFVESASSKLTLSGAPVIDEIYFDGISSDSLNISGTYTGFAYLQFKNRLGNNTDIGNLVNSGSISGGKLIVPNDVCYVTASGTNLMLQRKAAAIVEGGINTACYDDLQQAISAANGKLVRLGTTCDKAITISKNTYIDLNGFNIAGKVTVTSGTLYCMDSETDDYSVSDKIYGKLTNVSGAVAGIPEESDLAEDGYLMVYEDKVGTSFHRVNLQITNMSLRASVAGVYYKCNYACDEVAGKRVSQFGIAMSVKGIPNASNLESDCKLSKLTGLSSGGMDTEVYGTLLTGVMKPTNSFIKNDRNVGIEVYGRAYIKLDDGTTYMFGAPVKRCFREQVELIDLAWSRLSNDQKSSVIDMYALYADVMKYWDIPNIKKAAA